jgi:ParB family chromosome partitioning protein
MEEILASIRRIISEDDAPASQGSATPPGAVEAAPEPETPPSGLTAGEVADRVGRAKPTVSNRVRLLELPEDVLAMVERKQLSEGHARAVLSVPDHEARRRLARRIVRQGLSVRAAERLARWSGAKVKPRRVVPVDPALVERVTSALHRLTGFEARVTRGKVEVAFDDEHELAELAEALERAKP